MSICVPAIGLTVIGWVTLHTPVVDSASFVVIYEQVGTLSLAVKNGDTRGKANMFWALPLWQLLAQLWRVCGGLGNIF